MNYNCAKFGKNFISFIEKASSKRQNVNVQLETSN